MCVTNFFQKHWRAKKIEGATNKIQIPDKFRFGIASAAAQIEDGLNDLWFDYAKDHKIPGYLKQDPKNLRNNFWSNPEEEIDRVVKSGVEVYRLSVDWGRLEPREGEFCQKSIDRYKYIFKLITDRGLKLSLSLHHHSEARWFFERGSWAHSHSSNAFLEFAKRCYIEFHSFVYEWTTFNEVQMFVLMTEVIGFWPHKNLKPSLLKLFSFNCRKSAYQKSLDNVIQAHNSFYDWAKARSSESRIGIAHNTAFYLACGSVSHIIAKFNWELLNYYLVDGIEKHLDFLGINYYGAEIFRGLRLVLHEDWEYSDSGRAVFPYGLYEILRLFHHRYQLPFVLTEVGISDANDIFKRSYFIEHLKAVIKALENEIDVQALYWWSITDNFEWADGYLPKFGLYETKRVPGELPEFIPRKSYSFFEEVFKRKIVSENQIIEISKALNDQVGNSRPFTRSKNAQTALEYFRFRKIKALYWLS